MDHRSTGRGSRHPRVVLAGAIAVAAVGLVSAVGGSAAGGATGASSTTDMRRLPLGDGRVTLSGPRRGYVWSCQRPNPNAPGAQVDGPWIDKANGVFDATAKTTVDGSVAWPQARVRIRRTKDGVRVVANGLPTNRTTGVFPIGSGDDAFRYDRNPNTIRPQSVSWTLPRATRAGTASCVSLGAIGVALNGVAIYNALDGAGRDAVAHETLDACSGHPQRSGQYHYHWMPPCLWQRRPATRQSSQYGWALGGYPIYGPRGPGGKLYANADLDACHGLTSTVTLGGKRVRTYHYVATLEYPYTIGCFRGTPIGGANPGPP